MLRLIAGAVVFGLVQALLFARPPDVLLPPGESPAWFLNSGVGALAMIAAFFALGAAFSPSNPDDVLRAAVLPTFGGALAMMGVWLTLGYRSDIFPIVWAIGAGMMGFACVVGGWLGYEARARMSPRRD